MGLEPLHAIIGAFLFANCIVGLAMVLARGKHWSQCTRQCPACGHTQIEIAPPCPCGNEFKAAGCPRGPNGERCGWRQGRQHATHRAWIDGAWVTWADEQPTKTPISSP